MKKLFALWAAALLVVGCSSQGPGASAPSVEQANTKLVLEFYEVVLNGKNADAAARYVAADYIQHNPRVPTGLAPLQGFVRELQRSAPQARSTVKRVVAQGDLVVLHSHAQRGGPEDRGMALVDIFRVHQGKIVEHWDVMQPVPETAANPNGMF
ncbi:putative SnoaL-like aldol condensation-catalyzing enzyme [Acidovorax soli]|uniref:Putative SnoaL-like aldol condensation-catalyzing enzyme n=1 Tax=Acidovorax soli TaxID=592050 RepID=A0A7X0UC98_9BURK|nr:nuclear transport factor 2 family protein [Acidovorax soli]MBB6563176.1 putative SnoaL-like aldol condensation-catalyzing enzyme [Acidovorax soli]